MAACPQSTDVSAEEDTVLLPQFWLKNCLLLEAHQRAQMLQDQQRVMERAMPQKSIVRAFTIQCFSLNRNESLGLSSQMGSALT